jgi:class 3 adenylate cyclase/tetratricopeptide (TPR) repeat protein
MLLACSACGRSNAEDARFCSDCGRALETQPAREERKIVTVLFADLVGFTSRAETLDPEDVRELLSPYYARLRQELERFGGTVEKFIGDAVMALFGAPVTHEDDPERAVRAALAIRDWIVEEGELQVRIAVNSGEALVSLGARTGEGEGMAAGDVVNTTARIQTAAPVNSVLVGETTYHATTQTIVYEEAEPVVAKGKKDPLRVWRVVEPRSRLGVDLGRHLERPLIGRRHELDVLLEALSRARREGSPQLVTLVGVPGIGKSRLVREVLERVDADPELIFWRQGRCLPYGDGTSFWAIIEMIRAQAGLLETDRKEDAAKKLDIAVRAAAPGDADWLVDQLRPLIGLDPVNERTGNKDELFAALRRFFEALAHKSPLVLVFEDLHWADDALLDFIDGLVDRARDAPMLVLCTARPELLARRGTWGGGKANAASATLAPLSSADTSLLLASLLEQTLLPAELVSNLLSRAEGNPLFAEEYVRMLQERGVLRRIGASWQLSQSDLPLPETVQGIIAARLDALDEEEKALIHDAAVVGKVFWTGALCATGDRERWNTEETLHLLERRELVRRERRSTVGGETEYAFNHSLVRDVAYAQIPRSARARKHLLVAAWMESLVTDRPESHGELLAHHYVSALRLRPELAQDAGLATRARLVLHDAGDGASAVGAYAAAAAYYSSALELSPEGRSRTSLLLKYGQALFTTERAGGKELLLEARDALLTEGRSGEAAQAEMMIAEKAFDVGDGVAANAHLQRAIELVQGTLDDRSRAFVLGWGAWRLEGDQKASIALCEEGVRAARAAGSPELEALTLNGLGIAVAANGAFEQSFDYFEEGLKIARRHSPLQTIRSIGNFASLVQAYGDVGRARTLHDEGYALAVEYGVGFATGWLELELVLDRWLEGDWDLARADLDLYLANAAQAPYFMDAPAAGTRALIRLATGDLDGAAEDADWSLGRAREAVEHQTLLPALSASARVLLENGRSDEAGALVDELLGIERGGTREAPHWWFVDLISVLRGLGLTHDAIRLADRHRDETLWTSAASLLAHGDAAAAADALALIGSAPHHALACLESGDPGLIRRALEFYRSVGASRYAALAARHLTEADTA